MGLASGTRLGPYEILSALGAGGMGEVYRARDTRLERTVAVKILPEHLSFSAELKARFEREARAISSLNHPHICHLYDIGSQDGTAFLVMEFLEGESLADRLHKGALPLKQALEYGIQIAEALATAHRAGILHRDLKPGNVMLTANGAKLLDFGLAKTAPAVSGVSGVAAGGMTPNTPTMTIAELSSPAKALTQRGAVIGTFQYMAPEVLQGAEADARSDIFSFGCLLYEMVTGKRAFEGKSQLSVMTAILEKDPEPVSQVQPMSPAALDYLVKTCLEKNPEERFQTAQDVKLQLKWIAEGAAPATVPQLQKRPVLWWAVAVVAALIAVAATIGYTRLVLRPVPVVRSSILPPAGAAFVTVLPASGPVVISPDGSKMAFTARDEKGKELLYVRPMTATAAQALAGTDDAMYPFWSANSRDIGFFAQGKVKRVSANGGPVQSLADATNGRGGAWNKDGVILYTPTAQAALFRISANGGTPEPASRVDVAHGQNSHRWPHFLPDQKHFIFWGRSSLGGAEQAIWVGSLGSLEARKILPGVSSATYAAGYLLYLRDQTLLAQRFDASRLELGGEEIPVAEHVVVNGATGVPEFSASETGMLAYHTGEVTGAWDLLWYGRDGKPAGAVTQQDRYYYPALSPDETQVAVSLFNGAQGTSDVWTLDLKRGTKSRLTFGPGTALSVMWSVDGKTLYYASNGKGPNQIYAKAADGSGTEQLVLDDPTATDVPFSFSPDGRYLVYMRRILSDSRGIHELWALPMFGDPKPGDRKPFPVVQSAFEVTNPDVSPAGKWMVYQGNETGRTEIYIAAFPGGGARWQVSTNGGAEAHWRGDGKEIYFLDQSDMMMAVDIDTSSGTPKLAVPHALFQAIGVQRQVGSYRPTKDGKKFLINSGSTKQGSEPLTLVTNWTEELKK